MQNEEDIVAENALQRIGRFQNRPSLYNLEPYLFHHGPEVKEVIEISGDCGTGKTFLMKELTKKCILPKNFCDVPLNGLEAGVIYLNNDMHFNCRTFANHIIKYLEQIVPSSVPNKEEIIKIITQNSLKRLTIMNIYNSETMYVTFHLLKTLLLSKDDVSLIIIDSICANYWQDRMSGGVKKMDSYLLHVLNRLYKCIEPFKVTVMFTRPSYFQTKTNSVLELSPVYNLAKINRSIELNILKRQGEPSFHAKVQTLKGCFVKFYSIGPKGIVWS